MIARDELMRNIAHNVYPVVHTDFTEGSFACQVDFTWCQEAGEPAMEGHLEQFVRSLACDKIIPMTHAASGHHGYRYVNCKDTSYRLNGINRAGYDCVITDTNRIRRLSEAQGAASLTKTGLLFVRQ